MPEVWVSLRLQISMSLVGVILATGVLVNALTEEITSSLKVAQCRAACVHAFTTKNGSQNICLQNSDCLTCWENCQLLQTNFPVWEHICSQKATCFSGCETACQFMNTDRRSERVPILIHRGEEVIRIHGEETRWPPPNSELDGPWVYLVMTQLNNVWHQITQTLDLSAKIPNGNSIIRVLVVGKDGLLTIYSPSTELPTPRETARNVIKSLGLTDTLLRLGLPATEPETFFRPSEEGSWNLRELSVIHQQVIVFAEVTWEPRRSRALYLVTWQVDGGGIQGNLFTDSTTVTLSLWPDTLFHIQVEIVGGQRSEVLSINTRRKIMPVLERSSPIIFELSSATAATIVLAFCFILILWRIKQHNHKLVDQSLCDNHQPKGLPSLLTIMKLQQSGNNKNSSYQKQQLIT
ncbi:uncharacterized protein LOC142331238 [Lycorma delicatula]|uniref:uncharacterized protein LOC142331238 n=1 Tax=Lycorma delicatula TaxID=130591 RepID=UPI003F514163